MRTLVPVRGEPQVDGRTVTTRRSLLRHSPLAAATLAVLSVCYLAACASEAALEIPTSDDNDEITTPAWMIDADAVDAQGQLEKAESA